MGHRLEVRALGAPLKLNVHRCKVARMDLRQLEMFLAVIEKGGYSKAEKQLFVSHSAIHRQVRLLEHELNNRLLVRVGSHVEPTEMGKVVLQHARRIRRDMADLHREVAEVARLQKGYLRIGTGTMMLQFFLPPVIQRFRRDYPGIDLHLLTGTTSEVIQEMDIGNLDMGIIFCAFDSLTVCEALSYEPLYREEFVWGLSKSNPLAKKKTASLAQIMGYPLITYSKTSHVRRIFERLMEGGQVKPKLVMELESEESMEKMVEMNLGVAFLARRRAMTDKIHYVRIAGEPIYCEAGMVFPHVSYIPKVVKEFARMCREAGKSYEITPESDNGARRDY